jgi:esterase/lipase superfamily enzyme
MVALQHAGALKRRPGVPFLKIRPAPLFLAFVTALLVAGCSDKPTGVLIPFSEPVSGTDTVDIIVATTRDEDIAKPGMMFSGERATSAAFADIVVSIPPAEHRKIGEVQWPKRMPPDPGRDFVTLRADRIDEDKAVATFRQRLAASDDKHVLVFVHGYNNRFEDAVYRFAQIVHDSGADVVPVLFTWPSRGKLVAYNYDRESANYSRDALERILNLMAANNQVSQISILAHSMGNWLTLESLRQMSIRDGHINAKIRDVMLAAPDVDVDVFRTQVATFGEPRPRFTLFVSRNDKALAVSRRIWGSTARLGAIDPNVEPFREELARDGITVVDLTAAKTDRVGHTTFAESPEAVGLIGAQLAGGQELSTFEVTATDRFGQIAASTGTSIGTAAGIIVTAPIAVLDPASREAHARQVEQFNASVNETLETSGDLVKLDGSGSGAPTGTVASEIEEKKATTK